MSSEQIGGPEAIPKDLRAFDPFEYGVSRGELPGMRRNGRASLPYQ